MLQLAVSQEFAGEDQDARPRRMKCEVLIDKIIDHADMRQDNLPEQIGDDVDRKQYAKRPGLRRIPDLEPRYDVELSCHSFRLCPNR